MTAHLVYLGMTRCFSKILLCRRCQLSRRPAEPSQPLGRLAKPAVSTNFRRLKTQFYIGISRFLLGKRPVFFLVGFQNRHRPTSTKDPCHQKTAFSGNFSMARRRKKERKKKRKKRKRKRKEEKKEREKKEKKEKKKKKRGKERGGKNRKKNQKRR